MEQKMPDRQGDVILLYDHVRSHPVKIMEAVLKELEVERSLDFSQKNNHFSRLLRDQISKCMFHSEKDQDLAGRILQQ